MLHDTIIRAWKDPEYRLNLSAEEQALLPDNPAGAIELTDDELDMAIGGNSQSNRSSYSNSYNNSYSNSNNSSYSNSNSNSQKSSNKSNRRYRQSSSQRSSSSNSSRRRRHR